MNIFAPNYYVQSFKTLDIQKLHEMGIQLLLCDIDNSLWRMMKNVRIRM